MIPWEGVPVLQPAVLSGIDVETAAGPSQPPLQRPRLALATISSNVQRNRSNSDVETSSKRLKLNMISDTSVDENDMPQHFEEERRFAVEDLLDIGYTDGLLQHIEAVNAYLQLSHPNAEIHTPTPTASTSERYIVNGARSCSGSVKDGTCVYGVQLSINTASLKPAVVNGVQVLVLKSRCFLCTKAANLKGFKARLEKNIDGVVLCSQTSKCKNPRLPGRLQCRECADAWTATRIKLEMSRQTENSKPRFGPGSTVFDSATMLEVVEQLEIGLKFAKNWLKCFDTAFRNPSNVFVVDTETGFDAVVHEVGAVTIEGHVIVNDVVDHGCTLSDFYKASQQGLTEEQKFKAFCAINKTYGPPKKSAMPGSTARKIIEQFAAQGMSRSSWIEHSFGLFDYKKIVALAPPDLQHVLPAPENVFSTLSLWRLLLPGLSDHKQSHLFSLLCPDQLALAGRRHRALPDAMMCSEVFKVALKRYQAYLE